MLCNVNESKSNEIKIVAFTILFNQVELQGHDLRHFTESKTHVPPFPREMSKHHVCVIYVVGLGSHQTYLANFTE